MEAFRKGPLFEKLDVAGSGQKPRDGCDPVLGRGKR